MQVLWIKFCFPSRTDSTKVFTNVAASFVKASFVSSKEGFQQKFPQKLLQVLLEQVLFPVRVGLIRDDDTGSVLSTPDTEYKTNHTAEPSQSILVSFIWSSSQRQQERTYKKASTELFEF